MTPLRTKPLTTADAARAWGVSLRRAQAIIQRAGLPRLGDRYILTAANIERHRPGPPGRPTQGDKQR